MKRCLKAIEKGSDLGCTPISLQGLDFHGSPSQLLSSYQLQAYQLSAESETRPEKSLTATSYEKQLTADNSAIAMSGQSLIYPMQDCLANLSLLQETVPGTEVPPISLLALPTCMNHPDGSAAGVGGAPRQPLGGGGLGAHAAGLGRRQAAPRQGRRHLRQPTSGHSSQADVMDDIKLNWSKSVPITSQEVRAGLVRVSWCLPPPFSCAVHSSNEPCVG